MFLGSGRWSDNPGLDCVFQVWCMSVEWHVQSAEAFGESEFESWWVRNCDPVLTVHLLQPALLSHPLLILISARKFLKFKEPVLSSWMPQSFSNSGSWRKGVNSRKSLFPTYPQTQFFSQADRLKRDVSNHLQRKIKFTRKQDVAFSPWVQAPLHPLLTLILTLPFLSSSVKWRDNCNTPCLGGLHESVLRSPLAHCSSQPTVSFYTALDYHSNCLPGLLPWSSPCS